MGRISADIASRVQRPTSYLWICLCTMVRVLMMATITICHNHLDHFYSQFFSFENRSWISPLPAAALFHGGPSLPDSGLEPISGSCLGCTSGHCSNPFRFFEVSLFF